MPHPKKISNEEKFDSLIMSDLRSRTALNSIADTFLSASADPVQLTSNRMAFIQKNTKCIYLLYLLCLVYVNFIN